jgi:ABC-type Fe3+-siderophore transport system permease subunit
MTLGGLGAAIILWFCIVSDDNVFRLLALLGGALGWLSAILISPLTKAEEKQFTSLAQILSGVLTGYILSKADPLITALLTIDKATGLAPIAVEKTALRALIALCSYVVALLLVFCARAYWSVRTDDSVLTPPVRAGSDGAVPPHIRSG